jgi:hypothetical protein
LSSSPVTNHIFFSLSLRHLLDFFLIGVEFEVDVDAGERRRRETFLFLGRVVLEDVSSSDDAVFSCPPFLPIKRRGKR